jgi:plastocyanin
MGTAGPGPGQSTRPGAVVGPTGVPSAIGATSPAAPAAPAASSVATDTIRLVEQGENSFAFDPPNVRVPVLQTITWVNTSNSTIRVISDDNSYIDSGFLEPGQTFVYTPTLIGSTPYRDGVHPSARGSLVVVGP